MKKEELDSLVNKILANHTDTATVTETLQTFREDYSKTLSEKDALEQKFNDLETENQRLKENNMQLFLKIGNPVKEKEEEQEEDPEEKLNEIVKGWD